MEAEKGLKAESVFKNPKNILRKNNCEAEREIRNNSVIARGTCNESELDARIRELIVSSIKLDESQIIDVTNTC